MNDQVVMHRNCLVILIASAILDVACVAFVLLLFNRVDKYLTEPPAPVLLGIEQIQADIEKNSAHIQTLTFDIRDLQGNLRDFQVDTLQRQLDRITSELAKIVPPDESPD